MKAFIIVDVQNDFCPGGALAVKDGDQVVQVINSLEDKFDLVLATQDWHPKDHGSFASVIGRPVYEKIKLSGLDQILWPDHCVQDTPGADFHPGLRRDKIEKVFRKGMERNIDSYSGFFDNGHKKATGLGDFLKTRYVTDVYIAGLATDYCVKYTALDALSLGFQTYVIKDACRGVNVSPDDSAKAFDDMNAAGVKLINSNDLFTL
ncbi:MAG: bifunctional nicotinamidase/pyrazinamidase [Brevinematales bacterium]|jgi:nicotinamidase/pyrazinamidase